MDPGTPLPKPVARRTPTSTPFWEALAADEIRLQRCSACDAWIFYPRSRCSHCLSDQLVWHRVDPTATLHTFTVARQATAPAFADEVPQIIAVVDLAVGVRMTTTLMDVEPEQIRIGMPLDAVFDHSTDGETLLRFRPAR